MHRVLFLAVSLSMTGAVARAQEVKIAVAGLVHSHVWGYLSRMVEGKAATLVGVAETNPELIGEARKRGVPEGLIVPDWKKMVDEKKPHVVWAFVENNRHLEIVEYCAPRGVHVMFEKPLAYSYADAKKIAALAKKHQIEVLTNYQMLWWPANYAAKSIAESGAIGKVWRLRGIVGHGGPGSTGAASKYFFAWLTDPAQNGGGSLIDFGCYNALWSLWYLGRPEKVYAHVNRLRPDVFPKVEDNATLLLSYKDGVGLFEASWDLPRSFQDLEIFGPKGSIYMRNGSVTVRKGREAEENVPLTALDAERADPIAYMADRIRTKRPVDGIAALDINVQVVEILDAAQRSLKSGAAVALAGK
jgi:predicted dehydrogenase